MLEWELPSHLVCSKSSLEIRSLILDNYKTTCTTVLLINLNICDILLAVNLEEVVAASTYMREKKADEKKADADKSGDLDYEIYKVQPGDTPGSIARKYYGKASMYEIIMRANPQIKDAKLIQIGTELKIPKL